MTEPETATTPRMSSTCCPHCGCAQTQDAIDELVYVNGISGMNCTTCNDYFTVGEPVFVGFGGH